jgi:hypothetical protein
MIEAIRLRTAQLLRWKFEKTEGIYAVFTI